jgi:hypothetical protein
MGIEFKLSDRELPASPAFIRFLDAALSGRKPVCEAWPDQLSEELVGGPGKDPQLLAEAADRVMRDTLGRERVIRAYGLLASLLIGDTDALECFHSRFHFISVVGIPRTGGSYLTAELYRSIGLDPYQVSGVLAHDSFPEVGPFELTPGFNSWMATLKTTAEYLAMVEFFFADRAQHCGKIVVPKKLTQAAYAAGLFGKVFGPEADFVLTVRHPVAACVSTYEKSGGLPPDGRSRVRSNIEHWCRRDLYRAGWDPGELEAMDYFDAYLRYWELYYLSLATTGRFGSKQLHVVAYTASQMQSHAQQYHDRHGSRERAAVFRTFDKARYRHPDWMHKAVPMLQRVRSAWASVGLEFPLEEIERCE